MGQIKLICIPYAGGSSTIFNLWKPYLEITTELCTVELAGRGRRFNEPLYQSFTEAVNDVFNTVRDMITQDINYVLLGHSMGSILVYEVAQLIQRQGLPLPYHIVFSGRIPPHIKELKKNLWQLPDDEFLQEIKILGGTPDEFFENSFLPEIFIPIIRSDLKIYESYEFNGITKKLQCDISVFMGELDPISDVNSMQEWSLYTDKKCIVRNFPGNHFFISSDCKMVVNTINEIIYEYKR